MLNPIDILKEYCKNNSLRYTPEREIIVTEIYKKDGHFHIDHIFLRIRNNYPKLKLAKASIYRNIPHLINAGLIRESFYKDGHACYEHTLGHAHHDHIRCLKCGEITEFYNEYIDKTQQTICKQRKFQLLDHIHILLGYCEKCNKKKGAN
ncbi:MAG: transcriptional repressor [Candidatus Zapsychrus exili]|nr:transcriptional repressor [Candidatus Zapsychrus exili]